MYMYITTCLLSPNINNIFDASLKSSQANMKSRFLYNTYILALICVRVPFFVTLRPKDPVPNKLWFGGPGLDSP